MWSKTASQKRVSIADITVQFTHALQSGHSAFLVLTTMMGWEGDLRLLVSGWLKGTLRSNFTNSTESLQPFVRSPGLSGEEELAQSLLALRPVFSPTASFLGGPAQIGLR